MHIRREKWNTTYLFIPICYDRQSEFDTLIDALRGDENWVCIHDEIRYMLKYVAEKFDSTDPQNCQCFHFALKDEARAHFGIAPAACRYRTERHFYRDEQLHFEFQLDGVQLYCFSTTVCIMAFRISFCEQQPIWISSAQYYLKKVSRERIVCDADGETDGVTMLSLAERLMGSLRCDLQFDFFFYANARTERANILTYIEVEPKESYRHELYYLRRCYSEGFLYVEDAALEQSEIYAPSQDIIWGISPEAAVCLTCPDMGREDFIHKRFFKNFNAQYLFMYILLLHQKYVLYRLLTMIGIGASNHLETLERYRNLLYEFETDFVFSCVTEVPQYQTLYEQMTEAFSLKKLYEDVREPLLSLSEMRRADTERKQRVREGNVNRSLLILSLLAFFSALIDGFTFVDALFSWFIGPTGVKVIQGLCVVFILSLLVWVVRLLLSQRNND